MSVDTSSHTLLTTSRCIAINCSQCGEPFTDEEWETPQCFESIAQAVEALADADWEISDDKVTCAECLVGTPGAQTLAICEYCSPPLYSDHELPDQCRCTQQPVLHTFVPLVTMAHPSVRVRTCFAGKCTDCDEALPNEGTPAHYADIHSALAAAGEAEWMVAEILGLLLCPTCVERRACGRLGHTWPEQPDAVVRGIELRYCQRECGESTRRTVNDSEGL